MRTSGRLADAVASLSQSVATKYGATVKGTWARAVTGMSVRMSARGQGHGHGTHVAGTVGGATYGMAKSVRLVAVKVLNCSGSGATSGVISGIDWVIANQQLPAVANMSLGGYYSSSLNQAVTNATAAGITMVVAAGNDNANACNYSPASTPAAITVGATTNTDARSSFSNVVTCLDLFAPGSSITSAYNSSDTATATWSGASPAVRPGHRPAGNPTAGT